jgi:hypothetical protein
MALSPYLRGRFARSPRAQAHARCATCARTAPRRPTAAPLVVEAGVRVVGEILAPLSREPFEHRPLAPLGAAPVSQDVGGDAEEPRERKFALEMHVAAATPGFQEDDGGQVFRCDQSAVRRKR